MEKKLGNLSIVHMVNFFSGGKLQKKFEQLLKMEILYFES